MWKKSLHIYKSTTLALSLRVRKTLWKIRRFSVLLEKSAQWWRRMNWMRIMRNKNCIFRFQIRVISGRVRKTGGSIVACSIQNFFVHFKSSGAIFPLLNWSGILGREWKARAIGWNEWKSAEIYQQRKNLEQAESWLCAHFQCLSSITG